VVGGVLATSLTPVLYAVPPGIGCRAWRRVNFAAFSRMGTGLAGPLRPPVRAGGPGVSATPAKAATIRAIPAGRAALLARS